MGEAASGGHLRNRRGGGAQQPARGLQAQPQQELVVGVGQAPALVLER
ncbi:hypothetical protein [Streptomyces sp. NPDC004546]